jgi:hypothetical protein
MSDLESLTQNLRADSAPNRKELPSLSSMHQIASPCDTFAPSTPPETPQPPQSQPLTIQIDSIPTAPAVASPTSPLTSDTSDSLTPQQHNALLLLLSGRPDAAVAATLGLHRSTITRWRLHHPPFRTELQQRREEIYHSAADRLRTLLIKSLAIFNKALDNRYEQNRLEAASQILRLVNTKKLADPASLLADHNLQNRAMQLLDSLEQALNPHGPIDSPTFAPEALPQPPPH